jgi:hypothetical protein
MILSGALHKALGISLIAASSLPFVAIAPHVESMASRVKPPVVRTHVDPFAGLVQVGELEAVHVGIWLRGAKLQATPQFALHGRGHHRHFTRRHR